jgi:hypothetical protein
VKKYFCLIISVVLIMMACAKEEKVSQANEQERIAIVEKWLKAGDEVARKSNNEAAINVMVFLREYSVPAIPLWSDSDKIALSPLKPLPKADFSSMIVPLIPSDATHGGFWEKAWKSANRAFFFIPDKGNTPLIVLKDYKMSELWAGILLIHEGSHAYVYASGMLEENETDKELKNAYYELETYTLQGWILEALGGKEYLAIRNKEVKRIRAEISKKKNLKPLIGRTKELEDMFGESLSDEESGAKNDALFCDAMLTYFDQRYGKDTPDSIKKKLFFMAEINKDRNFHR